MRSDKTFATDPPPAASGVTAAMAITALTAILALPAVVQGQEQGLFVLDLPTSAAAAALGDAHPLFGSADNSVFSHPALLSEGSGFGAMFATMARDDVRHFAASASGAWWNGGVGIGLQTVNMLSSTETLRPLPGGPAVDPGPNSSHGSQSVISVGYAREVFGSLNVGAVVKLIEVRTGASDDHVGALDVGAATEVGPVALALSVQGLGPDPEAGSVTSAVDPRVSLGAATRRRPVGPLDVSAAATLVRESDGDFAPGGGLELSWWPITGRRFIGRVGLQRTGDLDLGRGFTLGGGFEGDDIALEYAFRRLENDLGHVHRFGVRWR